MRREICQDKKRLHYYFNYIDKCNMCGSDSSTHKILGNRLNQTQGLQPKRKIGVSVSVLKCSNCGLIYANPQPIPFDINDHYGVDPAVYWPEDYFKFDENYFEEIALFHKLSELKLGMKSLDIGVGMGKAFYKMQKMGFDVYGIEPSKVFRLKAIENLHINEDKIKEGMIEEVDFEENMFDFITFGAVMEHLYDPAFCIERAMKWLKPGGLMHIEVPSSDWLIPKFINFYYKLIGSNYVTNISPMHIPYHLYEFTPKSFQEHAKKVGYEIALHEYYVCEIYAMPKITHKFFFWLMKKTNTGMQLAVWLRKK